MGRGRASEACDKQKCIIVLHSDVIDASKLMGSNHYL